jgi:hypothetical protein
MRKWAGTCADAAAVVQCHTAQIRFRYRKNLGALRWSVEFAFTLVSPLCKGNASLVVRSGGSVAMGLIENPPLLSRTTVIISSWASAKACRSMP